jgi:hypothetical protein
MIKCRISALEEEENRRRNRIFTLPSSSYYVENSTTNAIPYNYSASRQPPSIPYQSSGYPDLANDYKDALKDSKEKKRNTWDVLRRHR